jgi:hypothetical protein
MFKKSLLFFSLILIASCILVPQTGKADPDPFTFTSPVSGESWMMGSTQTVSWTKDSKSGITHLQLTLLYDGAHIVTIVDKDVAEDETSGTVTWTVPTEYNNGILIKADSTYRLSAWTTGEGINRSYTSPTFSISNNPAYIPDLAVTGFSFAGAASTNTEPIPVVTSDSGYHVKVNIKNVGTIRALMSDSAKVEVYYNNTLATYHNLHIGFRSISINESVEIGVFIPATANIVQVGNANIKIVIKDVPEELNTSNNTATRLYKVSSPAPATYGVKVTNTPNINSTLSLRRGMTNVSLLDFKVKSIGSEGVKINTLFFYVDEYPLTSLTNFRIYKGTQSWPGLVEHGTGGGHSWTELTFPTLNTLTLPVGQEFEFIIKADVPSSARITAETYIDYWYDWSSYVGATSGQTLLSERDRVKVSIGVWQTTPSITPSGSVLETRTIKDGILYNRLKGNILLKTEDSGKAYYIHPSNKKTYYLGRPNDAFTVMREQGIGISNNDLKKIPVGVEKMSGGDQDGDGLSDLFEDAMGTDKYKSDSDNDGYSDRVEINTEYNPSGSGKLPINRSFSNNQKGRILLQVEGKGEAWYHNPVDNKRYFLGRPTDAFYIMQNIGLGISNKDFNTLN